MAKENRQNDTENYRLNNTNATKTGG